MNKELIEALNELERERGIKKDIVFDALEAALVSAYKKNFGSKQNVFVNIQKETGKVNVYDRKIVVEEVEDPDTEISLSDAKLRSPKYKVGDMYDTEVTPRDFGRISAQTAKQVVMQRIKEAERNIVFDEFSGRETDSVTGTVSRVEKNVVFIDLGKAEGVLPLQEQIPGEILRVNDKIKCYILEVKKTTKGPQIVVSRTHPFLVKRLFELEVPEIQEGVVEIKAISREAGSRSKIAVYSKDENVDPIGACIGPKGMRVSRIVEELKGEKMDIIKYCDDIREFIANSLSPAKVVSVTVNDEERSATIVVPDFQLSLAIGKEGQNARLSSKLTNWKIDIKSESLYQSESVTEDQSQVEQETGEENA